VVAEPVLGAVVVVEAPAPGVVESVELVEPLIPVPVLPVVVPVLPVVVPVLPVVVLVPVPVVLAVRTDLVTLSQHFVAAALGDVDGVEVWASASPVLANSAAAPANNAILVI